MCGSFTSGWCQELFDTPRNFRAKFACIVYKVYKLVLTSVCAWQTTTLSSIHFYRRKIPPKAGRRLTERWHASILYSVGLPTSLNGCRFRLLFKTFAAHHVFHVFGKFLQFMIWCNQTKQIAVTPGLLSRRLRSAHRFKGIVCDCVQNPQHVLLPVYNFVRGLKLMNLEIYYRACAFDF